jgi:hypothetical protein
VPPPAGEVVGVAEVAQGGVAHLVPQQVAGLGEGAGRGHDDPAFEEIGEAPRALAHLDRGGVGLARVGALA